MATNKLIADIDCIEPIPCDPCEWACPVGAIKVGDDITNLPELDKEKCTGCGLCVIYCPGLAIRLVEEVEGSDVARVAFPFEYLPLPEEGDVVTAVDKHGKELGEGTVKKVRKPLKDDPTRLVIIEVPREIAAEVMTIKRG